MSLGWGTAVQTLFFGRNVDVFVFEKQIEQSNCVFFWQRGQRGQHLQKTWRRRDLFLFCSEAKCPLCRGREEATEAKRGTCELKSGDVRHRLISCNLEKCVGFMKLWNCVLFWVMFFLGHILCWVFFLSLLLALLGDVYSPAFVGASSLARWAIGRAGRIAGEGGTYKSNLFTATAQKT